MLSLTNCFFGKLWAKYNVLPFLAVTKELMEPAKYPGSSGTRNLHDNISDLRAQVAANHKVVDYSAVTLFSFQLDS